MRTARLGPSVELPMGSRNSSLWGHATLYWVGRRMRTAPLKPSVELHLGPRTAVLGGGDACELCLWGLRWSSLWGHEMLYWVGEAHANCATGIY
eukprot:7587954-Pyramimonas_sp.AAC.1